MRIRSRKFKRRLAISTLVGNMLMIAITLSLAAILVAWAGTSFGAFTGGSQIYFGQRQLALQERLVIENVLFNRTGTNHTLMVFVRNVGVQQIQIAAIYVNGTSYTTSPGIMGPATSVRCIGPLPVTLGVGGSAAACEFELNWSPVWTSGSIFIIVVATARGNQATYTARGP